jgi:hypothetical protein
MKNVSGLLLAAVFAVLSLFHVYWAAGGRVGIGSGVPTVNGARVFNPSTAGTLAVAAALFCAMLVILGQINLLGDVVPKWIFRWATFFIGILFFLRAIGEFRLVGFFKQVRDTPFAFWDTWLFSPLCLLIAVMAFMLAYKNSADPAAL